MASRANVVFAFPLRGVIARIAWWMLSNRPIREGRLCPVATVSISRRRSEWISFDPSPRDLHDHQIPQEGLGHFKGENEIFPIGGHGFNPAFDVSERKGFHPQPSLKKIFSLNWVDLFLEL